MPTPGLSAERPAGAYRVRITARNPQRRESVVRATTISVSPPPVSMRATRFPVAGAYNFGGADGRFGAQRTGHIHQGQDITAAEGTPVVAVARRHDHWVAYQATGAGYYLVLAADGELYNYVFMHLQPGSMLVEAGDRVVIGQHIGSSGHGRPRGNPPALRGVGRPLVQRRPSRRPAAVPEVAGS